MLTKWGEALDRAHVLPEYPRPQMRRENWTNLNGAWEYALTRGDLAPERYDGEILVPFSPESELSGVNRRLEPDGTLWYRRVIPAPENLQKNRVLLHFGAVDQTAHVYVNGREVCRHTGGYLPFSAEITDALVPGENTLSVKVRDLSDTSYHSRGKQTLSPGGIWYTAQSGIWQTVWLETVPRSYISDLRITPLFEEACVQITVCAAENLPVTVRCGEASVEGVSNTPVTLPMPGFEPWSPEHPKLYDFSAEMGKDKVESYFAMRSFGVGKDESGISRLLLNGRPYFHTGVLDQGYWPDGLYTAPSDEAMVYDITCMKELGFNMLRKHIKIEPLRWYYHCDRLGMLVWQDMVSGGGTYRKFTISAPLVLGNSHRDSDYAYFARSDVRGREEYRSELDETVGHLVNCPSVAMWVPFNEGWGQFDAAQAAARIKALDPTRTVDHASGWHDQGAGDVKSLHVYFKPYRFHADKLGRPVALTEFGGYAHYVSGHSWSEQQFGYKMLNTSEALTEAYRRLYEREILPAKAKGLSAAVYTQLSDVEQEVNGFLTYDRKIVKLCGSTVAALNAQLRDGEKDDIL